MKKPKLPAPRLQLRWEAGCSDPQYQWTCFYELVLPLGENDIRREVYKDGRLLRKERKEFVAVLNTQFRGSTAEPCINPDGSGLYYDTPYRDGAHAQWDSKVLGGLPVYVIAIDGTPLQQTVQP